MSYTYLIDTEAKSRHYAGKYRRKTANGHKAVFYGSLTGYVPVRALSWFRCQINPETIYLNCRITGGKNGFYKKGTIQAFRVEQVFLTLRFKNKGLKACLTGKVDLNLLPEVKEALVL